MRPGVLLGKIRLPTNYPPLAARILDDWRGLYSYCKTRRLSIYVLEEEHQRLRALADSFYAAFRDNPQVELDETLYRVLSSVIIQGHEEQILFPFDLFIHESHADILPIIADRLRNSPIIVDERAFIDRLAREFKRIKIILKKNDIRIIKLISDPRFISAIGNLFPTETQIARQLGVTEATAEMRLRRLVDVRAIQLKYMAHPSSFGCSVQLVEHLWPLKPDLRKDILYSFEYIPGRGISCFILPSGENVELEDSSTVKASNLLFSWNLAQLDQWNKSSWEVRTQLTAAREEEEFSLTSIEVELGEGKEKKIDHIDAEGIDILQRDQGMSLELLEDHYHLSRAEVQKRLNKLVKEKHCIPMPYFLHIGLENIHFVYYEGERSELAQMRSNLAVLPQAELVCAAKKLVGVICLPENWSYSFATDVEDLKTEGHKIYYRVACCNAVHDPWKKAMYLYNRPLS